MRNTFLRQAFELQLPDAKPAEGAYVALMESVPYYGGPEEGGWWGRDTNVVAYRWFATAEAAKTAAALIEKQAVELSTLARDEHGRYCQSQLEWLDARGLDSDFLPEVDGPSEYYVTVTNSYPEDSRGSRRYE